MKQLAFVVAAVVVPGLVSAHPGHGSGVDSGWVHYFTEPLHLGLAALALGAALLIRRTRRGRAVDRPAP